MTAWARKGLLPGKQCSQAVGVRLGQFQPAATAAPTPVREATRTSQIGSDWIVEVSPPYAHVATSGGISSIEKLSADQNAHRS